MDKGHIVTLHNLGHGVSQSEFEGVGPAEGSYSATVDEGTGTVPRFLD